MIGKEPPTWLERNMERIAAVGLLILLATATIPWII